MAAILVSSTVLGVGYWRRLANGYCMLNFWLRLATNLPQYALNYEKLTQAHIHTTGTRIQCQRVDKRLRVQPQFGIFCLNTEINVLVTGQEKDQAKQIFTSSAASGILTNDLVKILEKEKVHRLFEILFGHCFKILTIVYTVLVNI